MGNLCSCCLRRSSDKSTTDLAEFNYGSADNNHAGHYGKPSGYTKDGVPVYRQLSTDQTYMNNNRSSHLQDNNSWINHAPNYRSREFSYQTQNDFCSDPSDFMLSSGYTQSSTSNLQHISEREPDEVEADPSLNPTTKTLFMQRSNKDIQGNLHEFRDRHDRNISKSRAHLLTPPFQRSNSTSTIWLSDSTVSRPDPKSTVRALAQAVYLQIKHRNSRLVDNDLTDIFDESLHPIYGEPLPAEYKNRDPDLKVVYRFIRNLFQMAQLSPECAIVTMIYLERLLTSAEIELTPSTWKRIVLCAIVLASKVWDDQAVWNVDYCQILRDMQVDDVNELERHFLEILQFNINVPSSVYAKYYFDIRSLCDSNCQRSILSVDRAHKLEACSRIMDDQFYDILHKSAIQRRKWGSLDTLRSSPLLRRVIIS